MGTKTASGLRRNIGGTREIGAGKVGGRARTN